MSEAQAPLLFDTLCLGCTGWIWFRQGRGWVHTDGHGRLWQRCVCGWSGSEASMLAARMRVKSTGCPDCGSFDLFTDHEAQPDSRTADERDQDPPTAEYIAEAKRITTALIGES